MSISQDSLITIFSALTTIFYEVNNMLSSMQFLLYLQIFACTFKLILLGFFVRHILTNRNVPPFWIYFFTVLLGSCFEDIAWIISLLGCIGFFDRHNVVVISIIRLSWAFVIVMYQALALFIESFTQRHIRPSNHQLFFSGISLLFVFYQFFLLLLSSSVRTPIEFVVQRYLSSYVLFVLMPVTLLYVFVKIQKVYLPKILKSQLMVFMQYYILPLILTNIVQMFPFASDSSKQAGSSLSIVACSSIVLTLALFYCFKKIMGLRFLNYHDHVHSSQGFNFTDDFKSILESLGAAQSISEIKILTQRFFKQNFYLRSNQVTLHVRTLTSTVYQEHTKVVLQEKELLIEYFLDVKSDNESMHQLVLEYLKKHKIFIRDEIEYNDFYQHNEVRGIILKFLNQIEADIFLPIYEQDTIIACIVVDCSTYSKKLYSDTQRDEMLVFSRYLSNVINLLQNKNLKELLKQRKDALEELYVKHQEINQYKESIRSFLRNNENNTGIIFYKNNKFIFGNEVAQKLIGINPNIQEGHVYTRALKYLVKQSQLYKTTQTQLVKDADGRQLVLTGIAHIESNFITIMINYPEISDVIKQQIDVIKDPSDWDYLLYLETTQSGKLVNQLIPGTGEVLLNFKINLLKLALSKKAVVLDVPEDDLLPMVELLHHISLREVFYTLDLQNQVKTSDVAIKLFGINPLFGESTAQPLLEKLNKKGTLFIKNIHLLDKESQDNLAQFIRYGFYTIYKSDKRIQSDVRIICSTDKKLDQLVENGSFASVLYAELKTASLSMPRLLALPAGEMEGLVDGFAQQTLQVHDLDNVLLLSDKERTKISRQRPVSFSCLKEQVQQLVLHKSQVNNIYYEAHLDSENKVSDPLLIEAARLGKKALKDSKMLALLWDKFGNQNKIALFLGVNRSSVSRRCKELGL